MTCVQEVDAEEYSKVSTTGSFLILTANVDGNQRFYCAVSWLILIYCSYIACVTEILCGRWWYANHVTQVDQKRPELRPHVYLRDGRGREFHPVCNDPCVSPPIAHHTWVNVLHSQPLNVHPITVRTGEHARWISPPGRSSSSASAPKVTLGLSARQVRYTHARCTVLNVYISAFECPDGYCNNGTCEVLDNAFVCTCLNGFTGVTCETGNNLGCIVYIVHC